MYLYTWAVVFIFLMDDVGMAEAELSAAEGSLLMNEDG